MSRATTTHVPPAEEPRLAKAGTAGIIGVVFLALTGAGILLGHGERVTMSWLIALTFWIGISLGILLLVMINHVFDASWSTIIRRTHEHWLAVFPYLALLFVPLVLVSLFGDHAIIWKWMDHDLVAGDILWAKKSAFLNPRAFTFFTVLFFAVWILMAHLLRKHSFAQDDDGSAAHTHANRRTSAWGIPVAGMTLTFAAFYWLMSLEHHWFSTMYGVWFFAGSIRAALAFTTLLAIYLVRRGVLKGIFETPHLLHIGNLMLAFTVFWGYISFSQYFLIWNANVPEETFWYNIRETGNWWWIGMVLIFGHFLVPFLFFLQHPLKKKHGSMIFICTWILVIQLIDYVYNILPAKKLPNGDPVPFGVSPWDVTALIAVGGICFWAFLNSFGRTRCIPIRDPRIVESLHCHE